MSNTPSKSRGLLSITTEDLYQGVKILTDSIKVIKDKGHTMYVFQVAFMGWLKVNGYK